MKFVFFWVALVVLQQQDRFCKACMDSDFGLTGQRIFNAMRAFRQIAQT